MATLNSSFLDSEIKHEMRTPKSHQNLKENSSALQFLVSPDRSLVLLKTLMGFSKMEIDCDLKSLTDKKIYALCTAYEAILSARHSKVVTAPAAMRNVILLKTTHNRHLLESVGAPSGGQYSFLCSIINSSLPRLMPPCNDFVSCDDNLQVKRVVSSSKLKENFKHTVKVVDSHVYLQNEDDKTGHVLKDRNNQPRNWLKPPTEADINLFEVRIEDYQMKARKVRFNLLDQWLAEETTCNQEFDPIAKLIKLRRSMPDDHNIFPCLSCGGEGIFKSF